MLRYRMMIKAAIFNEAVEFSDEWLIYGFNRNLLSQLPLIILACASSCVDALNLMPVGLLNDVITLHIARVQSFFQEFKFVETTPMKEFYSVIQFSTQFSWTTRNIVVTCSTSRMKMLKNIIIFRSPATILYINAQLESVPELLLWYFRFMPGNQAGRQFRGKRISSTLKRRCDI